MPRTTLELVEEQLAQDRDAVRPVERDGTQVENSRDGDVAAQTNEIDQDADKGI